MNTVRARMYEVNPMISTVTSQAPNLTSRRSDRTAPRRLKEFLSRLFLVSGLVAALAVGSFTIHGPSEAAATMPRCEEAINTAERYIDMAFIFRTFGYMDLYSRYMNAADALITSCY